MFKLVLCFAVVCAVLAQQAAVLSKEGRVSSILRQMTTEEKISLLSGVYGSYVGNTPAIDRLGIPSLNMQDGPQGFRCEDRTGGPGLTTMWPSAMTIASSFDTDLVYRWAVAMAEEFSAKGANIALAPGIGIARVPVAGRNFEYLCGEDPILGSTLVKPVVRGLQENGVMADAKHYVNNEIETQRDQMSAEVDERTRYEIYYPPFQAAIDAGVLTVMCSYNRIHGVYACENEETLAELRKMGFKGFVVSDWGATHSTSPAINAGLDIEMPYSYYFSQANITDGLSSKTISTEALDRSVSRILYTMDQIHLFDRPTKGDPMANVTSEEHNTLAREISAKSTVLLKNEKGLLPLVANDLKECIAVIGTDNIVGSQGSGSVDPPYIITPQAGIASALMKAGNSKTKVLYNDGSDLASASAVASGCEVAVVVVATQSGEGWDRANLSLTGNQDALISAISAANAQTVVVMNIPGAILMPWVNQVPAVLSMWMPGQEAGNALADILFGHVNPSARLPVTMPNKDNEIGFTESEYPGTGTPPKALYNEQLLIGYRWYDANQVSPVFPFGHGLSYTQFEYSALQLQVVSDKSKAVSTSEFVTVSFFLANIGHREGAEIAQVYLGYPSSAGEPPKQLRAFRKVDLNPGGKVIVSTTLSARDCSIWDSNAHDWTVVPGTYTVYVGASSRDIRMKHTFEL